MAKYSNTKAKINEKITTNAVQAITGNILNEVLQTMVDSLGADYQFGGLVQPGSAFTAGEQPVVFLATTPGTYTNFGSIVVADGEVALLVWSGTAWSKQTPDIATRTEVSQLGQEIEVIGVQTIPTTFNINYRIGTDGKLVTRTDNYSYASDFIAVTPQQVYWYCGNRSSESFLAIAGYSSNDENTFVSSLDNTRWDTNEPRQIIIPSGVNYIRIAYIEMYGVGGLWKMADNNSMINYMLNSLIPSMIEEGDNEAIKKFAKYPTWGGYVNFDNKNKKAVIKGSNIRSRINVGATGATIDVLKNTEVEYPNSFWGHTSLILNLNGTLEFVSSSSTHLNEAVVLVTFESDTDEVAKADICDSLIRVKIDEEELWEDDSLTTLTLRQFAHWEYGYRLSASGAKIVGSGAISNFIPVIPGQKYYYRASRSSYSNLDIAGYSSNDESTFVSTGMPENPDGGDEALVLREITIPNGVNYVRLQQISSYPSEYGFWEIPHNGLLEASVREFAPKQQEGISLENPIVASYLHNVDYSGNIEYTISYIQNYSTISTAYDKSRPSPVTIQWVPLDNNTSQRVEVSNSLFFTKKWTYTLGTSVSSFDIYNLIPNRRYYWRVYNTISGLETLVTNGSFDVFGRCRMLYIDGQGTLNYRDLGGWELPNGKHIKYGRLIRGAENYRPDAGIEISQSGIDMLVNYLGISVELDFGDVWQDTALPNTVEFLHGASTYGFLGYNIPDDGLAGASGRLKYYNSLHAVISRLAEGKNVYFHCNAGADRTGTFAFLIEALLGVSESDLSKDYELTSFYTLRQRNVNAGGDYGYPSMIAWIKANYNGDTLQEKVYDLCTRTAENNGIGLTETEINTLRNIMIEDD